MKNNNVIRYFFWPTAIALVLFFGIWFEMGWAAFLMVVTLTILEVTLSFDNAVVNASILKRMNPLWQRRFLTWGILLAVFGTRFLLPIGIVSIATVASPLLITKLAFTDPDQYSHLLESVHPAITAFGGMFLLMVSLKYFFNKAKELHWISIIERHLVRWGRIEAIEIAIALIALVSISFVTHYNQTSVVIAGLIGLILFIVMEGVSGSLSIEGSDIANAGFSLFIYLNVLDSAFSLDGVIGAFALTTNLLIIMTGLGIGAYFVRSMTVYFVKENTLSELAYLEHGAHWAIFGLSFAMFANLIVHVPEVFTGLIGLGFVAFAYYTSIVERSQKK